MGAYFMCQSKATVARRIHTADRDKVDREGVNDGVPITSQLLTHVSTSSHSLKILTISSPGCSARSSRPILVMSFSSTPSRSHFHTQPTVHRTIQVNVAAYPKWQLSDQNV